MKKCGWWGCNTPIDDTIVKSGMPQVYCSTGCKNKYAVDIRRREIKLRLIELKGGKCSLCGYDRCVAALEFHHRTPEDKHFGLAFRGITRNWEASLKESEKCDLVCANCHRELENEAFVERWNVAEQRLSRKVRTR